ncbi:methyltransferase-like protein 27 [Strongylocentrotus purpuratus]|uniref:Methyltransferase domain-containing protein n=1 Tax=Strongylocentrotus purpuratus TaxID=7668 RepID=A0A7M7SUJ4_STRPU|nr:methyltransferase-like protein 27 [Strongylocentrotus purpuratus]
MNVNDNEKDTKVEKEIPTDLAKWARAFREESNTDALEAMYDDFAEQYDKMNAALKGTGPVLTADALTRLVTNRDVRILDVGCGTGLVGQQLYDNGYRDIHGVDMSAGSLKVLEKKQIYSKLVKARFDPSTPLQYADGYFDVIISAGVFVPCHLTHACLPEIIRLLKAGGHILITTRKNVFDEEMAGIKLKSSFASLTKDGVLEKISHEEIGYATENDEVTPGLILSYKVLQQ